MSEYLRAEADKRQVAHLHSGNTHFYKVTREDGSEAEVSIKINCTCTYMGRKGQSKGLICSDCLAVLRDIYNKADIRISNSENIKDKRNACKQLVRPSNRQRNIIRYGDNEGERHQIMKREICFGLDRQKKDYYTEAIIEEINTRADIIILEDFKVIEVVDTESDESLEIKRKKYASIGLTMEVVRI